MGLFGRYGWNLEVVVQSAFSIISLPPLADTYHGRRTAPAEILSHVKVQIGENNHI